jgi:hypothetical protein|nr:MAG TPA: hypothetical protein [Caudoviricetes sp.]
MLEIYNVKVYDLKESVIASRNAMRLEMPEYTDEEFEESLKRAIKLAKCGGGTGHSNFRTGIRVSFDMKYTQYITKQFQRYHWFDYITSSSLMHRITKMDFDKCCNKYISQATVDKMNALVYAYNMFAGLEGEAFERTTFELRNGEVIEANTKEECLYHMFMQIISECPMGTELFVRVSTNYEQLSTIYKQRKNHKLKEDWGNFKKFVESLPYAHELIICDKEV